MNFSTYHQLLNRARWDGRSMTLRLLGIIIDRLVPDGRVVIGMDDTIERRWGQDRRTRHLSRPRSLQPWPLRQGQRAALAGLHGTRASSLGRLHQGSAGTYLAGAIGARRPQARAQAQAADRLGRQGPLQLCRWLPDRSIVFVGDSSFAVHELAHALNGRVMLISRLRIDANLFVSPPARHTHTIGRPAQKGPPLPKLKTLLSNPATSRQRITVWSWYDR